MLLLTVLWWGVAGVMYALMLTRFVFSAQSFFLFFQEYVHKANLKTSCMKCLEPWKPWTMWVTVFRAMKTLNYVSNSV